MTLFCCTCISVFIIISITFYFIYTYYNIKGTPAVIEVNNTERQSSVLMFLNADCLAASQTTNSPTLSLLTAIGYTC